MRATMRIQARGVAVLAALAMAAVACGGSSSSSNAGGGNASSGSTGGANTASAVGVTPTEVKVGMHNPLTGPAAPGYSEIPAAMTAMFNYINDTSGGVNGRKITLDVKDDGYNPVNTVSVTRELVLQDKIFAMVGGLGTPTHTKVVDFLNQQKVPDLFVASGCQCWNEPQKHPETFGWQVDYVTEGRVLGRYIKEHFAGKKIGFFGQNDELGGDGYAGLTKEIPASQIVSKQSYVTSDLSQPQGVGPQIAALKKAGADVVVFFTIPAATAVAKLTMLQLNYNPQLVVSNVGSDPATLSGLLSAFSKGKATAAILDGIVSDTYLQPYAPAGANAWSTLFEKIRAKYLPNQKIDGNVEYGMAMGYTFAQALKAAGQNPTRESLVKAVEQNQFSGAGLVPFRYSADNHSGYAGTQAATIKNGVVTPVGKALMSSTAGGELTEAPAATGNPADGGILTP